MSNAILEWLGGRDTGLSSKSIALTALGKMPKNPPYPHDGDDFGRCYRLLGIAPEAKAGLEELGRNGGPVWRALVSEWDAIESAYLSDKSGDRCYGLMQSIIRPAERGLKNPPVHLRENMSITLI